MLLTAESNRKFLNVIISSFLLINFGGYFYIETSSFIFMKRQMNSFLLQSVIPESKLLSRNVIKDFDDSFDIFVRSRDWFTVAEFWKKIISQICDNNTSYSKRSIPNFLGIKEDSFTDLSQLYDAGMLGEFLSKDERYSKRKTFAVRFSYLGSEYGGYQSQKNLTFPAIAVEDDLRRILGNMRCGFSPAYGAGRTDKGVTALSQVICFSTTRGTKQEVSEEDILTAFRDSDACRLRRLAALDCRRVPKQFNARSSAIWRRYIYLFPLTVSPSGDADVDVQYLNSVLGMLENKDLPYNAFSIQDNRNTGQGLQDRCFMIRTRASVVDLAHEVPDLIDLRDRQDHQVPVICIELVASRFLRRMVRKIVGTAIRECSLQLTPVEDRSVSVLVDTCLQGDRDRAAGSVPAEALCLAGVGYDPLALAEYKFMTKEQLAAVHRLRTLRDSVP